MGEMEPEEELIAETEVPVMFNTSTKASVVNVILGVVDVVKAVDAVDAVDVVDAVYGQTWKIVPAPPGNILEGWGTFWTKIHAFLSNF